MTCEEEHISHIITALKERSDWMDGRELREIITIKYNICHRIALSWKKMDLLAVVSAWLNCPTIPWFYATMFRLEQAGYVDGENRMIDNSIHRFYCITSDGRRAMEDLFSLTNPLLGLIGK